MSRKSDLVQGATSYPLPPRNLEALTTKVYPVFRKLIEWGYFSLNVEGTEQVPQSGPVIFVANHAGWFTLDTFLGGLVVMDYLSIDRFPWVAGQDQMFQIPKLGPFFAESGVFPSSWLRKPEALPPEMEVFCVYPEGTEGNCKSFLQAYQMQEWKSGFLRLALARGAKIVPMAIIGGEECMPVVATLRFMKPLLGTILPLPLSLLPLPAKWKFIFHEPVDISKSLADIESDSVEAQKHRLREVAADVRARVQRTLDQETSDRGIVRLSHLVKSPLG